MKKEKGNNNNKDSEEEFEFVEEEEEGTGEEALSKIRKKLKICVKEKQEYLDGWQRAKADLINARREFQDEKSNVISRANENLITELLSVVDSFEMAFSNKDVWEKVDVNWREGIGHIYNQLVKTLNEFGLKSIDTEGQKYNPNLHTSLESIQVESESKDGYIIDVLQKGYTIHNRVIRSARVRIGEYKK